MPWELRRLAQFVAPAAEATYYTVPAATAAIVKQAVVANTSSSPADLYVSVVPAGGVAGNQNRVVPGTTIPPGASLVLDLTTVMAEGDFLSARASAASSLTVTVSGLESPGSNGLSAGSVVGSPPLFGSPVAVGTANADGTSTLLPRADHVHRAITTTAPLDGAIAAALGAELFAARGDHRHRTVAGSGTPAAVAIGGAALGAAELAARSDHVHALDDTGWLTPTLQNGWTLYGDGSYAIASMYRRVAGIVFLRGLLNSVGATANTAFTLPAGFRPAGITRLFIAHADNGGQRYDITPAGGVTGPTARGWVSFSGISFPADQ